MRIDGFDWDDGNWPKYAKHGLGKDEIEFALLQSSPQVLPDRSGSMEARYNAVGKNDAGRHIFVVFAFRDREDLTLARPISARYMHRKEIEAYERSKKA